MTRAIVVLLFSVACEVEDPAGSVTLTSTAALDGQVDRAGLVDATSDEMEIGRNGSGIGVRGFLSFDVSDQLPEEGEQAVVSNAALVVYENNFNLDPWGTMGSALIEVVAYETLNAAAFDAPAVADAGVASTDSNFLDEHQIGVTERLQQILNEDPAAGKAQFRIRFDDDSDTDNLKLNDHHWDLNTAEATDPAGSAPTLSFDVTYESAE